MTVFSVFCIVYCSIVMEETCGNGVGRLFEATGAAVMVNNCFSLLRYVTWYEHDD